MLVELTPRVAMIPGGVNIGVLRGDGDRIVLVDTGINETSAKKVLKSVREAIGGDVGAILTTHAHADHFGGNAAVLKRTGARVYAPEFDEAVLRYPLLQPITLYGGADPLDTLRGGFLLGQESPVDELVRPGPLRVEGIDIEVISLSGHSANQVGFLVDGIFFCADVVLPETVLDKYKIPYLFSVTDHLAALETARHVVCQQAVPGHGPLLDSAALRDLIDLNEGVVENVADRILALAREPKSAESILANVLTQLNAAVADAPSFYLLQPTVFAFLSHLHRNERVRHEVRDGYSLWETV